jgi:hypothetical protein
MHGLLLARLLLLVLRLGRWLGRVLAGLRQ